MKQREKCQIKVRKRYKIPQTESLKDFTAVAMLGRNQEESSNFEKARKNGKMVKWLNAMKDKLGLKNKYTLQKSR